MLVVIVVAFLLQPAQHPAQMRPSSKPPLLRLAPLDFSSDHSRQLAETARRAAGDWIVPAIGRFERLFLLQSALAPGLAFVGAQGAASLFDPLRPSTTRFSAGGTGTSPANALVSCMGEGLEFLSQVERGDDVDRAAHLDAVKSRLDPDIAGWLADCHPALADADGPIVDWLSAKDAATGQATLVPADLCLRRSEGRRRLPLLGPLSSGCAAGVSTERAAIRAILELVERDAVALWWAGGQPGRPVRPDGPIVDRAAALLATLRAGQTGRTTWLLDITSDLGIPVLAALSADGSGRQLACGFGARISAAEAAQAAILEMTQVEAAFALVEAKLNEGGPAALDDMDRRHLRRGALQIETCSLLHPAGTPIAGLEEEPWSDDTLDGLIRRLSEHGTRVWLVDLTRGDYGVAVIRALAPALQPFPSSHRSARLLSMVAKYGGGAQYGDGIDIM